MKICQIITTLVYGGAERVLVNFSNIHAEKHTVDIVYLKGEPYFAKQLSPSIGVHHISLNRYSATNIRNLLKDLQPDVVHTHLPHADFLGLWASRNLLVKRFCSMQNIWFKWDWRDYLIFAGYRLLFNTVTSDCHVIGCGQSVADHVHKNLGVPINRVSALNNAIPDIKISLSSAQLRADLNIPLDAFCVLFVGRLRIQKSVDTLLKSVAQLKEQIPNLLVLIVGEGRGYEQDNLMKLSDDLGMADTVQFRGVTDKPEYYLATADVFVLPSVFEGLPLILLEAFRAALPIVASDIEGVNDLIKDGENGLLFTPKDFTQLTQKIITLYESAELRQSLGTNAYENFQDKFTIEKYARDLETLYAS